jgi:putative hemolysin
MTRAANASLLTLEHAPPFGLDWSNLRPLGRALANAVSPLVRRLLALQDLNHCHARAASFDTGVPFAERALRSLNVTLALDESSLERIPKAGPLIVVANHPFGGVDGLALLALLQRRRRDVKILANHLLRRIPEMHDSCFFVDPFGGAGASRRNLAAMRAALRWVRAGGTLAIFPAGEVSSFTIRRGQVSDPAWSTRVAAMIRTTGADVLPVFFEGRNSHMFQLAGLISPRLRTLMLPRELLKRRGTTVAAHTGTVIGAKKIASFDSDADLATYLRVRTYLLSSRTEAERSDRRPVRIDEPIAAAELPGVISAELDALPTDQHLAQSGSLRVSFGGADQLPVTLREIGRLREIAFRRAGEGTGRSRDIDVFDQSYLHLLVWDCDAKQVVGSYRLGLTDKIMQTAGKDGLYTHTLFNFHDALLSQISPAIELGRSFVRPEYQKQFAPLMLLWRGIGLFVARNPQYRMLFGPVSISNEYHSMTRQLLIEFLKLNSSSSADLRKLVSPRNPPSQGPGRGGWQARLAGTVVRTIEGIDELIGEIESDRSGGMPVLLRQYLKLNAKLLGFNVDPDFGDVLDGLMLVDLTRVPRAILTRYLGRDGAASFLAYHS